MRWVKIILAIAVALGAAVAALVIFRKPVAEVIISQAMAAQGLPNPVVRIDGLSINQIQIAEISAGPRAGEAPAALTLEDVAVTFALRDLLSARRVEKIIVGDGSARIRIDESGAWNVAGVSFGGGDSGGGLPFAALTIADLDVVIATPYGEAAGIIAADYDENGAGSLNATIESDAAGIGGYVAEAARAEISIALSENGDADGTLQYAGDLQSPYGVIREGDFTVNGAGSSWKDLAAGNWRGFNGAATISIRDVAMNTANAPPRSALNAFSSAVGAGPIERLRISGDLGIVAEDQTLSVAIDGRPISIDADNGARAVLDAAMGDPLIFLDEMGPALAGVMSLRSAGVSATASLDARRSETGWRFNVPVRLSEVALSNIAMNNMSAVLRGNVGAEVIDFEATANGEIRNASIGRFSISNTPGALSLIGEYDPAAKTAVIRLPQDNCAVLDRLSFKIAGQDMDASLRDARLCAADGPLAQISMHSDPHTEFTGVISAASGAYRLGGTRFAGAPPSISVTGDYFPAENRTIAKGKAKGGSVLLNNLLRFDRADADLEFALEKNAMTIKVDAERIRMSEYGDNARTAPIFAAGALSLAGEKATFNYRAFTGDAVALGAGAGEHNIRNATGAADFRFYRLTFAPGGLQPDELAPVLKGIIGLTRGAAEGRAQFSWGANGVASSADLRLEDVTFDGPGLTVTETRGVNGEISLSSLWPVSTAGAQTVTVGGVDFGALQLERGEIVFDMPGDDTLLVDRAIFPWFGGQIGVRGARATFTGGNALAPLRVESVDLKQILEFIDVEGLSGEGILNGELPLVVKDSRASFVGGRLTAEGPGRLSYVGNAGAAAAEAGGEARIAFDVLRDLRYETLSVLVDGPLDGRLDFDIRFEGTGEVSVNRASGRVPVKYNIALEAALLDFFRQANLSRNVELQIREAVENAEEP